MARTIVLVGGNEFRPTCVAMDSQLLRLVSSAPPRVVILPTAAAHERPERAAQNGVRHFSALGATASALLAINRTDWNSSAHAQSVDTADIIYFTGGDPGYLLQTFRETTLLAAILQRCDDGAIIVGSSAGAMVLGQYLRTRTGEWTSALGVLPGIAVIPHARPGERREAESLRFGLPEETILLAIGEATGCIAREGGHWDVVGEGTVQVIEPQETREYPSGQSFEVQRRDSSGD